jgi:hypothetical protein
MMHRNRSSSGITSNTCCSRARHSCSLKLAGAKENHEGHEHQCVNQRDGDQALVEVAAGYRQFPLINHGGDLERRPVAPVHDRRIENDDGHEEGVEADGG